MRLNRNPKLLAAASIALTAGVFFCAAKLALDLGPMPIYCADGAAIIAVVILSVSARNEEKRFTKNEVTTEAVLSVDGSIRK